MKKAACYIILISMLVHCSSRLGLINYLYEQRHDIAFSLGLTAERVIAICQGNYHQQRTLIISHESHDATTVPQAQEINLFFDSAFLSVSSASYFTINVGMTIYHSDHYASPPGDIFHPPLA